MGANGTRELLKADMYSGNKKDWPKLSRRDTNLEGRRRPFVLLSATIILLIAWSVLLFGFPQGMEPAAALLLVTPFAMCIIVAELSAMAAIYMTKRHEE